MDFYNDLITEKSWLTLQLLKNKIEFVLIGGWAVYLYTKGLKSKDIDIIVSYEELSRLKNIYPTTKNDRLKKYEARREEVQIDIYLPFYSNLGIPAEEIVKDIKSISAFRVPSPEMLLVLKQYTYEQRKLSIKGQKDKVDIFSLLIKQTINWNKYKSLVTKYDLSKFPLELKQLLKSTHKIPELRLNEHRVSQLKKKLLPKIEIV